MTLTLVHRESRAANAKLWDGTPVDGYHRTGVGVDISNFGFGFSALEFLQRCSGIPKQAWVAFVERKFTLSEVAHYQRSLVLNDKDGPDLDDRVRCLLKRGYQQGGGIGLAPVNFRLCLEQRLHL